MEYLPTVIENIPIHFIVGAGRSGTTLLGNIFNAHPNVTTPPENRFIMHFKQHFAHKRQLTAADIDFFCDNAFKFHETTNADFSTWLVNQAQLRQNLHQLLPDLDYATLCKAIYLHYFANAEKQQINTIIDKNPSYALLIEELLTIFPEAKFVGMVRDYRDNIQSRIKFKDDIEDPLHTVWFTANQWNFYNQYLLDMKQKYPHQILLVKYEDFAANAELYLQTICKFLNLVYDPVMINYQDTFKRQYTTILTALKTPKEAILNEMHARVGTPITTQYSQKWRTQMSEQDISIADFICSNVGKQFGYQPHEQQTSIRQKITYTLQNLLQKPISDSYQHFMRLYFKVPISLRIWRNQLRNIPPIPDYKEIPQAVSSQSLS